MRAVLAVSLLSLLCPVAASAQAPAQPPVGAAGPAPAQVAPRSARSADITRDDYIARAVERTRRAAEARFDRMDTDHDGVLTIEERRAARPQRRSATPQ